MSFLSDLAELCPYTVTAYHGTLSLDGAFTLDGTGDVTLDNCYIEHDNRLVRNKDGKEVVSSTLIITLEFNSTLNVTDFRYSLPSKFADPDALIEAISVQTFSDEDGTPYQEIRLP